MTIKEYEKQMDKFFITMYEITLSFRDREITQSDYWERVENIVKARYKLFEDNIPKI